MKREEFQRLLVQHGNNLKEVTKVIEQMDDEKVKQSMQGLLVKEGLPLWWSSECEKRSNLKNVIEEEETKM